MRFAWAAMLLLIAQPAHAQLVVKHGQFDDTFRKYTKRFFGPGYDWRHFKAQGLAESNLRPDARSYVGARGVMQIMPGTYSELRNKDKSLKTIEDVESNIAAGIMYDRRLWESWDSIPQDYERRRFMFASYNAGAGNIRRASRTAQAAGLDHKAWTSIVRVAPQVGRWRHRETIGYVHKIELFYTLLNSAEYAELPDIAKTRKLRVCC
jgi:membrane-bound lytic murein transglycosylase MltF